MTETTPSDGRIGPWAAGISEAERIARCRALRALCLVYLGPRDPLLRELRLAEIDAAASERARISFDALAALRRRRIISCYAALSAPEARRARQP